MGSSGGMSEEEAYNIQKSARLKAEAEEAQKQKAQEKKWQQAADEADVITEGGEGSSGGTIDKRKKAGTLAGAGANTFSKSGKLGE